MSSIGYRRSMVSYTPYGEIDRVHSGGPDIYRYKYTGQEEDKETGLYYYKARYYDPKIGRFLQPDTVLQTSSPFGTNQYMYVEGNPVMYNDPSGHWKLEHITKGKWVNNIAGGAKWISKGIERAGNTYSNFLYGKHHNSDIIGDFRRSPIKSIGNFVSASLSSCVGPLGWATAGITYGLATNHKAFLAKPLNAIAGYGLGGIDVGISMIANPIQGEKNPYVKHYPGGVAIYNSGISNFRKGSKAFVAAGFVAHLDSGVSRATRLHEFGHVQQSYTGWGGQRNNSFFTELEADIKAGTLRYRQTQFLLNYFSAQSNPELINSLLLYNYYLNGDDNKLYQMYLINQINGVR